MSLIDLYINDCGTIRRIGDNCHDQLTIDEDGRLQYYNLQNGDGCTLGVKREHDECFYEFVPNVDEYGFNCDPREADTPQTESQRNSEKVKGTPQTESTGSPIGDYRDGTGAWQTDCDDRYAVRTDSGEVVAYACPLGCEQTDCGWK